MDNKTSRDYSITPSKHLAKRKKEKKQHYYITSNWNCVKFSCMLLIEVTSDKNRSSSNFSCKSSAGLDLLRPSHKHIGLPMPSSSLHRWWYWWPSCLPARSQRYFRQPLRCFAYSTSGPPWVNGGCTPISLYILVSTVNLFDKWISEIIENTSEHYMHA